MPLNQNHTITYCSFDESKSGGNLPILHIREFAVACIRWGLLFPTRLLWRGFWSEMCEPAALPRTIFEVPFTGIAWQTWITLTNYSTETHFIIWSLHSPIWELDCFDTGQPALALSCIEHPLLNFASENLRLGQEQSLIPAAGLAIFVAVLLRQKIPEVREHLKWPEMTRLVQATSNGPRV